MKNRPLKLNTGLPPARTKFSPGKGDKSRVGNSEQYRKEHERIFGRKK